MINRGIRQQHAELGPRLEMWWGREAGADGGFEGRETIPWRCRDRQAGTLKKVPLSVSKKEPYFTSLTDLFLQTAQGKPSAG